MFLESINGFLYYIFLEFVRLFFDCEKRLDKPEVEEDNFTINFTKTYKRDFESIEYDFPILHVNITRKIWYSAQQYFSLEEIMPTSLEEKLDFVNSLKIKFVEKNYSSIVKLQELFKNIQETELNFFEDQLMNPQLESLI